MSRSDIPKISLGGEAANASHFLRWLGNLSVRIFSLTRVRTSLGVLATILSQISLIVAFFMPIKILFLLESDRVPRYFPESLRDVNLDQLVIVMMLVSMVSYLLYLAFNYLIKVLEESASETIVENTDKLPLGLSTADQVRKIYSNYSAALAGLVFLFAALIVVFVIYPLVFFLVTAILGGAATLFLVTARKRDGQREKMLSGMSKYLKTISTVGFFVIFIGVLFDFRIGAGPNIIVAIISILFVRQGLNGFASSAKGLLSLFRDRQVIETAFFREVSDEPAVPAQRDPALDLILTTNWATFIETVLTTTDICSDFAVESVRWSPTSAYPSLDLWADIRVGDNVQALIVRVYSPRRAASAAREVSLLSAGLPNLPAPKMLGVTETSGIPITVLDVTGCAPSVAQTKSIKSKIRKRVSRTILTEEFVDKFRRSTVPFGRKITSHRLRDTVLLAHLDGSPIGNGTVQKVMGIARTIDNLPLYLWNPDDYLRAPLKTARGEFLVTQWSRWTLRPLLETGSSAKIENSKSSPKSPIGDPEARHSYAVTERDYVLLKNLDRALAIGDVGLSLAILRELSATCEATLGFNHRDSEIEQSVARHQAL